MVRTRSASVIAPFAALVVLAGVASSALAQTPSFTLVGRLPEGGSSEVYGLSADGRSASGVLESIQHPSVGFLWTAEGGRNDFGLAGIPRTLGWGISGDGQYVVGGGGTGSGALAFRWSQAGGYQNLGTLPGFTQAEAHDASFDGSVIVGTLTTTTNGIPQAFRWTQSGGMQGLGGGTRANAISGNGNVIVGTRADSPISMVWTAASGVQTLAPLGGPGDSEALAINFDGSIIAGRSGPGVSLLPTMWINGSPMELLSAIPNSSFAPHGLSDDGSTVAGQVQGPGGSLFAGVWTQATGIIRLSDYLTANGVTIPPGIVLENCTAISADGLTFAGYTAAGGGIGNIGFVASLHRNCVADLDDGSGTGARDHAVTIDDLLYFLAAFEAGNLAVDLDNGTGTGTHDNAVTVEDLLFFLTHFEAGC